jgi:hypothetical protein
VIRKAFLFRAVELDSPSILGMLLYTDREKGPDAWYRRGVIDSVEIDMDSRVVTIGVDQRDYIHMDAGREVLLMERPLQ